MTKLSRLQTSKKKIKIKAENTRASCFSEKCNHVNFFAGYERIRCYQGVVVWDTGRTQVLLSLNTTQSYCPIGEKCGQFEWVNADDFGRLST